MLLLPADPGNKAPPTRLPLTPEGGYWQGKDGRAWRVPRPDRVLSRLGDRILVLDENHSSFYQAPKGEASPAMARLSSFSMDTRGVIWANKVEWTAYGKDTYAGGKYLGLSPVVLFDASVGTESDLGEVVDLHSVALVNDPNLLLPALNASQIPKETQTMAEPVTPVTPVAPIKVDVAPVIDVTGPVTAAMNAAMAPVVAALQALPAAIQAAVAAVKPAEVAPSVGMNAAQLHEQAQTQACESLITAGKLPNSAEARATFKRATRTAEDLAATITDYGKLPAIVGGPIAGLNGSVITAPKGKQLDAQQTKLCAQMGWDPAKLYPEAQ